MKISKPIQIYDHKYGYSPPSPTQQNTSGCVKDSQKSGQLGRDVTLWMGPCQHVQDSEFSSFLSTTEGSSDGSKCLRGHPVGPSLLIVLIIYKLIFVSLFVGHT